MRIAPAQSRATASRRLFIGPGERERGYLHLRAVLTPVVCAATLVGCAECLDDIYVMSPTEPINTARESRTRIPLPDQALLTTQPEPDCEAKPTAPDAAKSEQPSDPNADLALRIKLEYERECYRRAEMRVRERLQRLQSSTANTIKAVKRLEQNDR